MIATILVLTALIFIMSATQLMLMVRLLSHLDRSERSLESVANSLEIIAANCLKFSDRVSR
jgi:hypothetical protein